MEKGLEGLDGGLEEDNRGLDMAFYYSINK
jgi:hypothetical protein